MVADPLAEATEAPPSDAALIGAVRRGDTGAYGQLYERHLGAARRAAATLAATQAEREDLVAEVFTRVLRVLRSGQGPTNEFRAYLLVTLRNTAINAHRRNGMVSPYADVPENPEVASASTDAVGNRLHAEVAASAFASLPERWRMVLWLTEVEGKTPMAVARMLRMTPNGVAALAYRAREGLRRAYLEQHVATATRSECRTVSSQLAGWVRHGISDTKMRKINAHLNLCPDCRALADELVTLNQELPCAMTLLLLALPLTTALSTGASAAASVVSVVKGVVTAAACTLGTAAIMVTGASTVATDPAGPANGGVPVSTPGPPIPAPSTGDASGPTDSPGLVPAHESGAGAPESEAGAPESELPPDPPADGTAAPADAKAAKQAERAAKKAAKQEAKEAKQEQRQAKKEAKKSAPQTPPPPPTP